MSKKYQNRYVIVVSMSGEEMRNTMVMYKNEGRKRFFGFTLIEIIIVVAILAIAALLAIPMLSTAADTQLRSAANMIAADLEYARSMAISTQQKYSVVFSSTNESYEVRDSVGNVIDNPINAGSPLSIVFPNDSRLSRVVVVSADFDGDTDEAVTFDYLGSPYSGLPPDDTPLSSGEIHLQADSFKMRVEIEQVTGYITIHQE